MSSSSPNDQPPASAQTMFCPNAFQKEQMPLFKGNQVPRYLFRIVAPQSAGSTTTSKVKSPATTNSDSDKFRRPLSTRSYNSCRSSESTPQMDEWT
ncbi:hypothetical protein F9C07_2169024 [Aspergillus flavus]|uniref:Uncharacterized protein n=1 Tax=Aspergillus flavus (strain ATCC 200026 / FGSC A1120 / IAM 13836 / NRRL 3357 / JCM 12722 / SRRC 167) TaxID=332952 RepID=A0A7U2N1Y3_ASPFN|nr:hypothetical protein F9C07_2169024 [Aspergillus flavus]